MHLVVGRPHHWLYLFVEQNITSCTWVYGGSITIWLYLGSDFWCTDTDIIWSDSLVVISSGE